MAGSSRSIRFRHQRSKRSNDDIDITSLLDILTILLVFLIANNSFTGEYITLVSNLVPPVSHTTDPIELAVVVQMNKSELWVDGKKILDLNDHVLSENGAAKSSLNWDQDTGKNIFDQGGKRIIGLFNELKMINQSLELTKKTIGLNPVNAKNGTVSSTTLQQEIQKRRLISLVIDQDIPYSMVKKLLYTSAEAGFEEYKLIVLGQQ